MTQPASYTFVPWFRQGAAAGIEGVDDVTSAAVGRAAIAAALTLSSTPLQGSSPVSSLISQTVELVGPGDISSVKAQSILRAYPPADARNATPGELAYVEFYDEDLPWRYTPARAAAVTVGGQTRPQLRPWLALFVLAQGEFEVSPRAGGLPVLTVTAGTPLPPPAEAWAWAHAQIAGDVSAASAAATVATDPDASLSRVMSPRRLLAGTQYTAFIVPAFETGRLAGLGDDISHVPTMQPSWGPGSSGPTFPVYYSWQFTTGTDGSFESYVRRLSGLAVDDSFGKRTVSGDLSAYGLPENPVSIDVEGALQPPEFSRADFTYTPGTGLAGDLTALLDLAVSRLQPDGTTSDDPGIVPPVYGRWHAGVLRLSDVDPQGDTAWILEANLDLRERASAGLGAQVVRDRQDELIARAWAQVGSLHDVNQRLREAELAVAASTALFQKHFAPVADDELFLLSAASHHGLPAQSQPPAAGQQQGPVPSVRSAVAASLIPSSVQDGAFKRATRPVMPLVREATGVRVVGGSSGFRTGLVGRLNDSQVTAAPPVPPPAASVSLATVTAAAAAAATAIVPKAAEPKHVFWQMLVDVLTPPPPPQQRPPLPTPADLRSQASQHFTAWQATNQVDTVTAASVNQLIGAITSVAGPGDGTVSIGISQPAFTAAFGQEIAGKSGNGVTITCDGTTQTLVARFADDDSATEYGGSVTEMTVGVSARRDAVPGPAPMAGLSAVTGGLHGALHPAGTLTARVTSALPGFAEAAAERAAARQRALQPVMAYPVFPDAMVSALQAIDREYVLPNMTALPDDTLTLMTPNGRFMESFFAGLNTQLARELLWREYPTDQRGSYFRVFWDRADAVGSQAATDIAEIPGWTAALGGNGSAAARPLVLVIRSELLRKYPNTLVYAQAAIFTGTGHTLDLNAAPVYPAFHATMDPDVSLIGFPLTETQARGKPKTATDPGDPGMYFVVTERPGQLRFGLDDSAPAGGLQTWDDLSWSALADSADYLKIAPNSPAPASQPPGTWAATSADMAAILFRSPVMYARHAASMLPPDAPKQEGS